MPIYPAQQKGVNSFLSGFKYQITVASADGAIAAKSGMVYITKASAAALTLADPTSGADDGKELLIIATTAYAHTVSNAAGSGFNGGGAATDVGTYTAAVANYLRVTAYAGKWWVTGNVNVTLG